MMELNLDGNYEGTVRSLTGARQRRSAGLPNAPRVLHVDRDGDSAPTPLLLYAEQDPHWRGQGGRFLHKPLTSPRQLWGMLSALLDGVAPPAAPPELLP